MISMNRLCIRNLVKIRLPEYACLLTATTLYYYFGHQTVITLTRLIYCRLEPIRNKLSLIRRQLTIIHHTLSNTVFVHTTYAYLYRKSRNVSYISRLLRPSIFSGGYRNNIKLVLRILAYISVHVLSNYPITIARTCEVTCYATL